MEKIKTIHDFIFEKEGHSDGWYTRYEYDEVVDIVKKYTEYILDYFADTIEADYTEIDTGIGPYIEVFVKRGEFEEIKKLIK